MNQDQNDVNSIIELLFKQFGGAFALSTAQVAKVIGQSEQGIRNQVAQGTFPIPSYLLGGKLRYDIRDVAAFLSMKRQVALQASEKRGPGRPFKAEQIARRRAASC